MRETSRHRRAYETYLRLGAGRSIERLHAVLNAEGKAPALRTLYEWSRQVHWQDRIVAFEQRARQAQEEAELTAIREMHERQAKEALLLQQKGTEWLVVQEGKAVTTEAAIRAITEGARLERLVRGEPIERTEPLHPIAERLKGVDDAQLERLLALAERPLDGEGAAGSGGLLGLDNGAPDDGGTPPDPSPGPGGDRA